MSKKYQLKNGLTVILSESHRTPVVSVQMWVRTGSADEQKGEEGISHFIEHLVFKGTEKFKVGEIASLVEGSGGELNAYTSFDQTVFYVTLSKEFADVGLLVISEMMGFPSFDPQEIDNEREVVVEEIKRGKDSLGRRGSELLFKQNFKKHPYGIPVIGYEKNVRSWSAKKIKNYYQSRYNPKNMFLVVSGDFNSREMAKKIDVHFGRFQSFKLKKISRKKEPAQNKARLAVETANFQESMAYLSWKVPGIRHKDIPALDVLAMVLGQGDSSRLVQKLRIEKALVNSVGASTFTPTDGGIFAVSMGFNPTNWSQVLPIVKEEILRLQTQPFSEEEVRKAVLNLESEEFFSMETVDGLSRRIGSMEFYFKDLEYQKKYIKAVRALTGRDLQRVAKKYLSMKTFTFACVSQSHEEEIRKSTAEWVKIMSKQMSANSPKPLPLKRVKHEKPVGISLKESTPKIERVELKNGVTVLLRPSTDTALISLKCAMLGGARRDPENCEGATELLGRSWMGGTARRTEAAIYHEVESMAAALSPVAGRNSLGLGMEFIASFEEQASDLFFDILKNPLFPKEVVEREKLVQLEQIKSRNDNAAQSAIRAFSRMMFPKHPYGRDSLGSEDSLKRIDQELIKSLFSESLKSQNLFLVITGHLNSKFWLSKIEKELGSLKSESASWHETKLAPLSESFRAFEANPKEQSHLVFGYRGLTLKDDDRYVLHIIQSILAGQGGRLFIELRDKNSLAYSVSPLRMEGVDSGYFGAYIGCSPDKVSKSISMIREQFQILCDQAVGESEILRAKRYLIGRHDIDLQRSSSVASSILYDSIYGLDYNETFKSADRYRAVTAKDIQRVAQNIFSQREVVSVAGPQCPW